LEGSPKTRIVYQANLNFKNASNYLDWLIKHGFLIKRGKIYMITSPGQTLLANLTEIISLINEDIKGEEPDNQKK
jgi:predicted transcriptional regulator